MSWEIHKRFKHARRNKINQNICQKEHWTTILIKAFHQRLFHTGTSHVLFQMRYIYWISQGRSTVKAVIYQSDVCRKYNCRPYKMPKLADWPKEKISKAESFTYTELDYIGPFTSKIAKRRFGSVFLHV